MATQKLVEKPNKEVKDLRKDISEIKAVLLSALNIPEENLKEYKNSAAIRKALQRAYKTHHSK